MINSEHISLPLLYLALTEEIGSEDWLNYEPETLVIHLEESRGITEVHILREKIIVLQAILTDPDLHMHSADFILHAVKVCNNELADFDIIQVPTSLEYAWFLKQLEWLYLAAKREFKPSGALFHIGEYVLMEDGFSVACEPFKSILGLSSLPQEPVAVELGQESPSPQDIENKANAVLSYISHMTDLSRPI